MKKYRYILLPVYFSVISSLLINKNLQAYQPYHEKVVVLTDRTLYIIGEKIQFAAVVFESVSIDSSFGSRVLYVELITPEGNSISAEKFLISNRKSNGQVQIPDDLISGVYYLKSYTKWMRNEETGCYCYTPIKIINPYKKEFLGKATDRSQTILLDTLNQSNNGITISLGKDDYKTRDTVRVNLTFPRTINPYLSNVSVSVVPDGSLNSYTNPSVCEVGDINYAEFLPEIKGITISGKVVDTETNKGIPFTRVNLSVLGNEKDLVSVISDSSGRYCIGFQNYYGVKDLYINAVTAKDVTPRLLIDNDFCQKKITLPMQNFFLSGKEKRIAVSMAKNLQVDTLIFGKENASNDKDTRIFNNFYGRSLETILFDKFVQLPTIEEYFNEFIGNVEIRKKNDRRQFRVTGNHVEMQLFEPLVMIDMIPIEDHERLLRVNPQNISRIEILSKPYVKGNTTYAGIISFFSKKHDFAGIDLPSSSLFFDYKFFSKNNKTNQIPNLEINMPDCRNSLYWNPNLRINHGNSSSIKFLTGDTPGSYLVVVRCLNEMGEVFTTSKRFEISQD